MTRHLLPCLFVLSALAACGSPQEGVHGSTAPILTVSDAWCRPTPNGARAGACYATLRARNAEATLVAVSTPGAAMSAIHRMTTADGRMSIDEMEDGLPLPVDEAVVLAPGGTHMMLMGLTGPLVEGTTVPLTLTLADGQTVRVDATVRKPAT